MGFFWSLEKYFGLADVWVLWKFLHLDEPAQEGGAAEWTNNSAIHKKYLTFRAIFMGEGTSLFLF